MGRLYSFRWGRVYINMKTRIQIQQVVETVQLPDWLAGLNPYYITMGLQFVLVGPSREMHELNKDI